MGSTYVPPKTWVMVTDIIYMQPLTIAKYNDNIVTMGEAQRSSSGIKPAIDMAVPLCSRGNISLMIAEPSIYGLPTPLRKRKAIIIRALVLTAEAMAEMMKRVMLVCRAASLPYSSDDGAKTSGPRASPKSHIESIRTE